MKIVLAFGTFDLLHSGHLHYLQKAKKLAGKNGKLIVIIARDSNVKKIKGFKPINDEKHRKKIVSALRVVDKAVLGRKTNLFKTILDFKPDIIALGYDQKVSLSKLKNFLKENSLECKIKCISSYKEKVYKTSKIKNKFNL